MRILMIVLVILCCSTISSAHPASNIKMSYSQTEGMLTINFVHVTEDREKHYIHEIDIVRGDGKIQEFFYPHQSTTRNVSEQIPIELKPDEVIHVKLYCSEGGLAEASYVVQEEDNQTKE